MRAVVLGVLLVLAACDRAPDNGTLAEAEARAGADAAEEGRINCAMGGAKLFDRKCTLDRMSSSEGAVLIVGRADAGYRRLLVTNDGRGVISADGAEAAAVSIIGDGMIEVAVGGDRFRLPADTDGGA
ncbi:MAG: hypothetical protein HC788_11780 [Sphingopyxis sp.]|nr:hypothetical protein [Sphingopyxis sp.]